MISISKIATIFSKSLLYIIDILRSNDANIYTQIKENLENQEISILKTNSEIAKDLVLYENEMMKYENEKAYDDPSQMILKESDFAKLEKYEILKKLNENLKLELAQIKEKFSWADNKNKSSHVRKDSLKSELEECVKYRIYFFIDSILFS